MRTLITGCTLVDGTGAAPRGGMAVLIEDDRIESVGAVADYGTAAEQPGLGIIDGRGMWLLPGLINMHEHLSTGHTHGNPLELMGLSQTEQVFIGTRNVVNGLRHGWTTIREMGSGFGIAQAMRGLVERGELMGPRILACGAPLCVTGGHAHQFSVEVDGVDGFRRGAREQLKAGADFIKVMASHDPYPMPGGQHTRPEATLEEIRAAYDEARRWGKHTACHVMGTTAIAHVLDAGVDVVDHGVYLDAPLAERMADQGTFFCPTLSSYDSQTMNPTLGRGEAWARAHAALVQPHRESFRVALRGGVKIVVGTDSAGLYGEELELMRKDGMSPMDTILACTSNAAQALCLSDRIGSVTPGRVADLVLLSADPLLDPYAIEQVELVVKDGVPLTPEHVTL